MKLEFDVKVTEKDLYSFNIEQAYKGSQGVISLLFAVLLAAAAVLSAQKGNTEYVVLYIGYSGAAICAVFTQGQGKDDYEDK